MKTGKLVVVGLSLAAMLASPVRAGIAEGKDLFFNRKGTYGACAFCHVGGGSAGRWDQKSKTISQTTGSVIANLKGIGSRKTPDQIKRIAGIYAKKYGIQLSPAELSDVVMWLTMANK